MKIDISHNPFLIETTIQADGERLNGLEEKLTGRLQEWIDRLFSLISDHLAQPKFIELTFQGLDTDFDDIQQAAIIAREREAIEIDLRHTRVDLPDKRLNKLDALMQQAQKGELKDILGDHLHGLQQAYENVLNPDFEVNVIATMSAGKSTIINSMLGKELLPAKNEACTATIARIYDEDDALSFEGEAFDDNYQQIQHRQEVDKEKLNEWNSAGNKKPDERTAFIHIYGNIPAIQQHNHSRLVLVDTPGPNNSQNEEHGKKTYQAINSSQMPMVLYVLNATQPGVNDDQNLLVAVKDIMQRSASKQARDRFIFLINKIDELDNEKGESITDAINKARKYLGIENPIVLPVSASLTLMARKGYEKLTKKEKGIFPTLVNFFNEDESLHLLKYMNVSPSVKKQVEEKIIEAEQSDNKELLASIHSGIPVLECVIDEYLRKYALPNKISSAYLAIEKILEDFNTRQEPLIKSLNCSIEELEIIQQESAEIQKKISDGAAFKKFKEETLKQEITIDIKVEEDIANIKSKGHELLQKIGNEFTSHEVTPSQAESLLKKADRNYKEIRTEILALLEQARNNFLQELNQQFLQEYQNYVSELFDHQDHSHLLESIDSLKKAALSLSSTQELISAATSSRKEVVGTYQILTRKWYYLWISGETETRKIYENKEYTNLNELWDKRSTELKKDLGELAKAIIKDSEEQAIHLRDSFLNNAAKQLEPALSKLVNEVLVQWENEENKVQEIENIKNKLATIENFKKDAKHILEF